MKNFQTLIFGLFISCLICSCANEEHTTDLQQDETALKVGTMVDGEIVFDNRSAFKAQWEQGLRDDGIDVELSSFEVDYSDVGLDGVVETILIAQNADQSFKSAIQIEEKDNEYFKVAAAGTLTCTGCTIGCYPKKVTIKDVLQWICMPCINAGDCVKTVSIEIDLLD